MPQKVDFEVSYPTAAQKMGPAGFCRRLMARAAGSIVDELAAKTHSFCEFYFGSTVRIFSSDQMKTFSPALRISPIIFLALLRRLAFEAADIR